MSKTQIEWCHRPGTIGEVWNVVTGCDKVDRGCKHCYAETMHRRLTAMGSPKYAGPFLGGATVHSDLLALPTTWKKPRTVFVNSMADLFHPSIHFNFLIEVFKVIRDHPRHTFLVLTKRPEHAAEFWGWMEACDLDWRPPGNLWMGTSVHDQASADLRVPFLLELTDCLRFLSYEPALGPLDLRHLGTNESWSIDALGGVGYADGQVYRDHPRLNWVICGGESGHKAAPMHPDWARKVRDDCAATSVPFFFKQFGQWMPHTYILDGLPYTPDKLGKNERLFTLPRTQVMRRSRKKSFNLLDGKVHQEFPAVSLKS